MIRVGYITLKELRERVGKTRQTVWLDLKRRQIKPEGHSVSLAELHDKWPTLYRLLKLAETEIRCPKCTGPVVCECVACEFAFRPTGS